MNEGYFSQHECAGGCGNLIPQHVFDAGKRYLWGHKNGCPKEGESPHRKPATRSRPGAPGPVVETSYARTLDIVKANSAALYARCAELDAQRAEIERQSELTRAEYDRQDALRIALQNVLEFREASSGT